VIAENILQRWGREREDTPSRPTKRREKKNKRARMGGRKKKLIVKEEPNPEVTRSQGRRKETYPLPNCRGGGGGNQIETKEEG